MNIEVRDAKRRFGEVEALAGVSITFSSGKLIAIVGESGCGKTTLLRAIAGLETLDAGEVWFDDARVAGPGYSLPAEKRGIGFVFQAHALWPHMSVFNNVAYGLRAQGGLTKQEISRRVEATLDRVGLAGKGKRYPHQLSGGQRQRVSLSRAMVLEPRVLLMDEPLSSLDANLRRSSARDIRRLQSDLELTTLYVTHDMDEAMTMADYVVVMRDGRVVEVGSPRDVYRTPSEPFVAEFTGEISWLEHLTATSGDASDEVCLKDRSGNVVARGRNPSGDGRWPGQSGGEIMVGIRPESVEFLPDSAALRDGMLRISCVVDDVIPGRRVDDVVLGVAGQVLFAHGSEDVTPAGTRVDVDVPLDRVAVFPQRSVPSAKKAEEKSEEEASGTPTLSRQ